MDHEHKVVGSSISDDSTQRLCGAQPHGVSTPQPSATRFAQPATQPATDGWRHEQKRRGHARAILAIRIALVLKLPVLEQLDRDAEEERRDEQRARDDPRFSLAQSLGLVY